MNRSNRKIFEVEFMFFSFNMDKSQQPQERYGERQAPPLPGPTPSSLVLLLMGAGVVAAFQVSKAPPMLLSIRSELGMSLFLFGLIARGGQTRQVINPPVLALMVSMGEGGKSAPWLLGDSAAAGVGFL